MSYFKCNRCGAIGGVQCPKCESSNVTALGDLSLSLLVAPTGKRLDAYVGLMHLGYGIYSLIIKKPSGQEMVVLREEDFR